MKQLVAGSFFYTISTIQLKYDWKSTIAFCFKYLNCERVNFLTDLFSITFTRVAQLVMLK